MAKTRSQIRVELALYQCCLADLAIKYILKEMQGQQGINCLLNKVVYGSTLLEAIKCTNQVLTREHLTQTEYEDELEKLNDLCGCIPCDDPEEVIEDLDSDQIPAALTNLILQETGYFIQLEDNSTN